MSIFRCCSCLVYVYVSNYRLRNGSLLEVFNDYIELVCVTRGNLVLKHVRDAACSIVPHHFYELHAAVVDSVAEEVDERYCYDILTDLRFLSLYLGFTALAR